MPKTTADAKPSNNRFETSPKEFKKAKKDPFRFQSHPSPFFLFMSDFRVMFMAKNPFNTSVAVVGKAGGQKWKSMSNADKAPYIAMAEKKKEEYELHAYNSKLLTELLGERSFDKSESGVKDEEEDDGEDDERINNVTEE